MRSLTRRVTRARQKLVDDAGISLLEAVIALLIASSVFLAMALAGMTAVRASLVARATQQVGDFMSQQLERTRSLSYTATAMRTGDITGDANITACAASANGCFSAVSGTPEAIVATTTGGIYPHVQTISLSAANNVTMTMTTYVTSPYTGTKDTDGAKYRRVTVVATWKMYGRTVTKQESTIMTNVLRGLPLPVFKLQAQSSTAISVNPAVRATYFLWVNNLGARDRFNLAHSDAWAWAYYLDSNNDGVYTPAIDTTAVTDTNGDGIPDTGFMEPNTTLKFFAVYLVPGAATAQTHAATFSATSVAQPSAQFATQSVATTTTVVVGVVSATPTSTATPTPSSTATTAPPCAAAATPTPSAPSRYTLYAYSLHNDNATISAGIDTTAQALLDMDRLAPEAATLAKYSTDVGSTDYGRRLLPTTVGWPLAAATTNKVANWRYQFPSANRLSGTGQVTLWERPANGVVATSTSLVAYVYQLSGATETLLGTVPLTVASFTCTGFQQVVGTWTFPSIVNVGANDYVGVKVINTGTTDVDLAYDVTTTYPASLVLPVR